MPVGFLGGSAKQAHWMATVFGTTFPPWTVDALLAVPVTLIPLTDPMGLGEGLGTPITEVMETLQDIV